MSVRILKNLITFAVAITIFASAFYLSGGFRLLIAEKNQDIAHPVLSKAVPHYGNRHFLPMGNKISVNNLPMELGYFTTKDDLKTVRDELIQKFRDSGLNPHYYHVSEEEGFIQTTDKMTGEHKIIILKRTTEETMVFAGITPAIAENLIAKPDKSLGIPPDAMNYIEVKNQDYGRFARTISFQLRGGREGNLRDYKNSLSSLGFEENDYFKKINDEGIIAFGKENIQIIAVITESENESGETITSFVLNVLEKKDEEE
ncbi:MAG: hypothetical protein N3B13_06045 [Deltaproteobacteria bacterium]|nr:hypothetical protein [Deltaproteobacteria bacterium]